MGLFAQAGLASVNQVRVAGGGARSALWRKILASVLGAELVTVNSTEGAAYGAALLAGVGAGAWKDVAAACESAIAVTGRDEPDAGWQRAYEAMYPRYRALYPALKGEFAALGAPDPS
jgi:xylulokinase